MLAVTKLVAGVDGRPIARLDDLRVAAGGAALLVGPSGVGKTTVLLALAGLADMIAGSVRIGGDEPSALRGRARDRYRGRHIALVFQDLHLVAGLSVLDNLRLGPFAAGLPYDRPRAVVLLDRLGLADRAQARAETLSRGEAQRVAIGRALLHERRLVLADEPTASLDDAAAATVLDALLEAARAQGAALVIATHDARVRARIPQAVAVEPAR